MVHAHPCELVDDNTFLLMEMCQYSPKGSSSPKNRPKIDIINVLLKYKNGRAILYSICCNNSSVAFLINVAHHWSSGAVPTG